MNNVLDKVNNPEDIKGLSYKELNELADEIREFLISSVSKTGGHLASNLGVVELTIALNKVFSFPKDKIVWDVGHQSYVHKILTGRKNKFHTLRKLNGLSGFPKTGESEYDSFNTGHSSTSISAALGMAKARDIKKENFYVMGVIGDGALTGGMAFEAMNDAGRSPNDLILILNDNEMSINKNVGGLSTYLSRIRTEPIYFKVREDIDYVLNRIPAIGKRMVKTVNKAKGTIKYMIMPGMLFEELGLTYLGPVDGHNIFELTNVFKRAKKTKGPVLIHVYTTKGKGYSYAEKNPGVFHGISEFDIETGKQNGNNGRTFTKVFGKSMIEIASQDDSVVAVSAAMPDSVGLEDFTKLYPWRIFDVGIAEQHAVTFAAGLSAQGLKPVVAIYSSFLQRAYDQILHDVGLQNLHVVFAVDRAGIVGSDGETHQGIYDLSYLSHIPNMVIMAPSCYYELEAMLKYAVLEHRGPIAIRYPRGKEGINTFAPTISTQKAHVIKIGSDITILAAGKMVAEAVEVSDRLYALGIKSEVINAKSIKPLDKDTIINSVKKTKRLITLEDNSIIGGMGSLVLSLLTDNQITGIDIKLKGFPDEIIPHGTTEELLKKYFLDVDSVVEDVLRFFQGRC